MLTTADFRRGLAILVEGQPYIIVGYTVQTPSARGAATLVRARARNVITGRILDMTFKAGDKFHEPDLERRKISYLYSDGDDHHFMDEASFDQFHLNAGSLGDAARWLREGITLRSIVFEGRVVGVEVPQFVEFEVVETGPGGRSDMASGKVTKRAHLSNGSEIKVPVYLEAGEHVVVDTTTGEFVKRAGRG
ncbi:MAG: elongation factor P [Acidobacteria bacterium]|nr:elongation factor P [Acidobacteriota bacterium]